MPGRAAAVNERVHTNPRPVKSSLIAIQLAARARPDPGRRQGEGGGAMSLCAACGIERDDVLELCPHHTCDSLDYWADGNRILCDWMHRGIEPARLDPALREDTPVAA
jgi:hypothetical protein